MAGPGLSKQHKQMIGIGALLVVFVFVMLDAFKPKKKRTPPVQAPTVKTTTLPSGASVPMPPVVGGSPAAGRDSAAVASVVATAEEQEAQKKRAAEPWGIDPFYHTVKTEVYRTSNLVLKGISLGRNKRGYAFINDDIVTIDDIVMGYKVMEVQKNKVLLKKGGERFYLVLPEDMGK